jgi:hypothetical protein
MAWVFDHAPTQSGTDQLVLLAIADRCNDDGLEAWPSLGMLAVKTRLSERAVWSAIRRLVKVGALVVRSGKAGRRSNCYQVVLSAKGRTACDVARGARSHEVRGRTACIEPGATQPGTGCEVEVARGANDPSSTSITDHDDDARRAAEEEACRFWAWWCQEFPFHNGGAAATTKPAKALPVVEELLAARGIDKLKAMAIALWKATGGWIAMTDRSIFALRQGRDQLDQLVSRALPVPCDGRPAIRETREAVLAVAVARLEQYPAGPLKEACASAAARLRTGVVDAAVVDAELVAAARAACVDVGAIEAKARLLLSGVESRVAADVFRRILAQQIDQLLRESAQLPDLLGLVPR